MKRCLFLLPFAFATPAISGGLSETVAPPPVIVAPPPAPASDWTGPYVGLSFGFGTANDYGQREDSYNGFGAFAGYQHDLGRFVPGVEYEFRDLNFSGDFGPFGQSEQRLKLRAGYDTGPVLVYGFAGNSLLDFGAEGTDNNFIYGLGADYAVNPNWRVGLEYLRSEDGSGGADGLGLDIQMQEVSLRVSFAF